MMTTAEGHGDENYTLRTARQLLENGLRGSAELMAHALLSRLSRKLDANVRIQAESFLLFGDCLFENREFSRALKYYEKSLQASRHYSRSLKIRPSELEIRVSEKYARCILQSKRDASESSRYERAKEVLEAVPESHRTVSFLSFLASVYEHNGYKRGAIDCYRQIIKKEPCAIEAYTALLDYEIPLAEVSGLIPKDPGHGFSWVRSYINAHYSSFKGDLQGAIVQYKQLDKSTFVAPFNIPVLLNMADCNMRNGNTVSAYLLYTQIQKTDPDVIDQMDRFIGLIKSQGKVMLVNLHANSLYNTCEERPEAWVAMGRYCEMKGDKEKALTFAEKAISLNKMHVEAYYLKASILESLQRFADAIIVYRQALQYTKEFVAFQGLIDCYLNLDKIKEALVQAKSILSYMPNSPQAITLVGKVLSHLPDQKKQALAAFRRALEMDPKCVEAVLAIVATYIVDKRYEESIDLLESHIENAHTDVAHTRLAELHAVVGNYARSMKHYNTALSINPDFEKAKEGILRIEMMISGGEAQE
ncbi:hypothetical protein BJ742DRAFT_772441 [Cladochytrium replicatum]|nr:hypothetical protein BJ742DRAFT_772441 [Cladochytrium replicatum]